MQTIVVVTVEESYEVISSVGIDLGRTPKTRPVKVAKAAIWMNNGTDDDLQSAKLFCKNNPEWSMMSFPLDENDPLGKARKYALKMEKSK